MKEFCCGFLIGCCVSFFDGRFAIPFLSILALFFLLCSLLLRFFFLMFVSGFLWGMSHNAKLVNHPCYKAKVIQTNFLTEKKVIFRCPDSVQTYFAFGNGSVGSYGRVDVLRGKYVLGGNVFTSHHFYEKKEKYFSSLREKLDKVLDSYANEFSGWFKLLVWGDSSELEQINLNVFKHIGIYHLLVVSGMHISLLYYFFCLLADLLIRFFYCLRILSFKVYRELRFFSESLSFFCVAAYVVAIGLPDPAVRSLLVLFFVFKSKNFIRMSIKDRLLAVLFLDMLLFPTGFLAVSNLLSWSMYFAIMVALRFYKGLKRFLFLEFFAASLLISVVGSFSIFGFLFGQVLSFFYPFFFLSALIGFLFPYLPKEIIEFIFRTHGFFIEAVSWIDRRLILPYGLYIEFSSFLVWLRLVIIFLWLLLFLSIGKRFLCKEKSESH